MAANTDQTTIQFRLVTASKEVAVQSPRAQCGKKAYQFLTKYILEHTKNRQIAQAKVRALMVKIRKIRVLKQILDEILKRRRLFLRLDVFRGRMHIGGQQMNGGRL
jgi:tRNA uridine 5-carboxymethylaminomethyl modification enzyme